MEPKFFASAAEWREWLADHHSYRQELLVGFYKTNSGRPSITWPEAVDGALCFGWIDGVRRRIDDISYTIRFSPRKPRSTWSTVNINRVAELLKQGLMRPAGMKAFEAHQEHRSRRYSFEQQQPVELDSAQTAQFEANPKAWKFFRGQAPSYQRAATWWVISAKQKATQERRLLKLIETSQHSQRIYE